MAGGGTAAILARFSGRWSILPVDLRVAVL
jgi:hypothetical protein